MFGNILIDKLRFSKKIGLIAKPFEVKSQLDIIMKKHFIDNAYSVNFDKQYIRVEFTPTRYLDEVFADSDSKPNLNLEMLSECNLLNLLKEIYDVLGECNVTWIDLTKNIITKELSGKYIQALYKRKFKYPYKPIDFVSNTKNVTLTLAPLKRKKCVECVNKNRQITFYNKLSELETRARVPFIDNVWLTEEEIAQIPSANYSRELGRLYLVDMYGFNILRCEQRYKYTANIKRITHYLLNSKEQNSLDISTLIDFLERGQLYSKLDEYYTSRLREYVFLDKVEMIKKSKNKFIPIIKEVLEEFGDIDMNDFQPLFEELGNNYKDIYKRSTDTIQQQTLGIYYNELYHKFNI